MADDEIGQHDVETCLCYSCDEARAYDDEDDDSLPADADYAWHNGRAQLVETVPDISTWSPA